MYGLNRIKIMSDFLSSLKREAKELKEKTDKLSDFLTSEQIFKLSNANNLLLNEQYRLMTRYYDVLQIRVELLEK